MNEDRVIETLLEEGFQALKGQFIGLSGTLGAGKTHLVKKLLKKVDPTFECQVQSPTFNICNVYSSAELEVHHFDLYRLNSEEELYDIEIWESISNMNILILVEWVDQFPELMHECNSLIIIDIDEKGHRQYEIKKN